MSQDVSVIRFRSIFIAWIDAEVDYSVETSVCLCVIKKNPNFSSASPFSPDGRDRDLGGETAIFVCGGLHKLKSCVCFMPFSSCLETSG